MSAAAVVAVAGCIEAAWGHTVPGLVRIEVLAGRRLAAEPGVAEAVLLVCAWIAPVLSSKIGFSFCVCS